MMKISKFILIATLFVLTLSSCERETCPTPFCTMNFNLTAPRRAYTPGVPIESVAAFLRNEMTGEVFGPINFDMTKVVTYIDLQDVGVYACSIKQPLPYGKYTMWLWANVENEETYSFDRFSLRLHNNYEGADYLLGKAREVILDKRHDEINVDLEQVVATIDIAKGTSIDQGVALYVENVYGKVDANGTFSEPGSRLEFEEGEGLYEGVPPSRIFTFPSSSNPSSISLSFKPSTSDPDTPPIEIESKNVNVVAGDFVMLTFGTGTPPVTTP